MPRFYCPQPLAAGATVDLPEAVAHHLHVVRMQAGDEIVLFNGEGGEFSAVLASVEKRRASATLQAFSPREAELPFAITLVQGLPEGAKMDWIVEKAVEMGVARVQPLAAQRSVVRLSGERAEKRLAHWEAVAVAASEQSGRNRVMEVSPVADFGAWIGKAGSPTRLLLSPRGQESLTAWARRNPPQPVCLLVGPEGGFNEREEDAAVAAGAIAVSMGPRILRTETAGIAAVSALGAAWEAA